MNSVSVCEQVSLIHATCLLNHSVSTHLTQLCRRFSTLPLSSTAFPCGSRLRLWLAGSSSGPAVSSLSSYGLVIHLLLLSTTHCRVAVAFGYRPESVYLERTCTSLTTRAFRRTSPDRQVGVNVFNKMIEARRADMIPAGPSDLSIRVTSVATT